MGSPTKMLALKTLLLVFALAKAKRHIKGALNEETENEKTDLESLEKARQFSLFSVVTFPNDVCTAKSDSTMKGTCYTTTECAGKSGKVDGHCASGFGVCCTFILSACSSTVTKNTSYIQNPSYPTAYKKATTCSYSVTPLSSDICQLRLDFDYFALHLTTAGVCSDKLEVTVGSKKKYQTLCGYLKGQHIYLETG